MATHSSILAWRISATEEPGGLQSMGSHRVRHQSARARTHTHTTEVELTSKSCIYIKCTVGSFDTCIHCGMIATIKLLHVHLFSHVFSLLEST